MKIPPDGGIMFFVFTGVASAIALHSYLTSKEARVMACNKTWCKPGDFCSKRCARAHVQNALRNSGSSWSEPMGGCDSGGNPVTAAFGSGSREGETFLGDGDRSEVNFHDHENHDHYGSGNGRHDNGTSRGQYSGPGH